MMDTQERFSDGSQICLTCGALAPRKTEHNDWHNKLEGMATYIDPKQNAERIAELLKKARG